MIRFELDGESVDAVPGETLWAAARRHGVSIPHLCHRPQPGYRPDGNCRACVVEIAGERTLAPACLREAVDGMVVSTTSERATRARQLVFELLVADQPPRADAHDSTALFWHQADRVGITHSRFPRREPPLPDSSHPAMQVALDACIHCRLCVRACRDIQVNDVIGMARRGHRSRIVFDQGDPMGASSCVGCGECVQACPTGALMERSLVRDDGSGSRSGLRAVDSVCPFCGVGCQLSYQVRDNSIVTIEGRPGPANENRLCIKGRFGFDYITHPHRLKRPLIRRTDAPKRGDLQIDPAHPETLFREADWDEALAYAARGLVAVRDRDGGRALAGFGSAKCSNEEAYLFQKLVRTGFGSNNVDHCTRLCHASSVAALLEGVGSGAVSAPFTAAADADVIVVIGANPTENHPVAATYFKQAAKRGCRLIVMDPRGMALKRHATHMLQFRPGTDVALLNALLHVIINEELYDAAYVTEHTDGFDRLCKHVQPFTPEAMADVCGIDATTLRTVARTYAQADAAIIFWGMGVSQHVHGTDNARCLIALALVTGQIGRPGTGLHPLRGQNNVQGASDAGLIPMMLPNYRPVADATARQLFESAWGSGLDPEPGLTVVEVMDAIHAGRVRGMYILGENPAMSDPDLGHARDALARLEHLVVQDLFLTETAIHADVVLPAAAWPEKDGTVTNTNRQVQRGRRAVPPPGEARQDWWITQEIARRMGCDWHFDGPASIYAEMASLMPALDHISWERVSAEGAVTYPCPAAAAPGEAIVFADGFPTANGRGRLVTADIVSPAEQPDADYPMVLTTGRQLEHWHTGAMTRRARILDDIEPEASASLAPADLARMRIEPGAMIRVSTRRGAVHLRARRDPAIPAGMVFVPFCYAEAPANALTNPALDPFGKIPEFKYCAARVEPAPSPDAEPGD